jgi:hypothetical protein
MCWGFECGDGWYNILDQLMSNIQHHIDWKNQQRKSAIKYNEMAAQAKAGNFDLFEHDMQSVVNQEFKEKRLGEIVAGDFRAVPPEFPQVTLDQVKEKFGTLRFYYTGGDEYISGLVSMAESMSGVICESCGAPAETNWPKAENGGVGGWVRTICEPCDKKRNREQQARLNEYKKEKEKKHDVDYKFVGEESGEHD